MIFTIPLHIYPLDVIVSIGQNDEQLLKSLERILPDLDAVGDLLERPDNEVGRCVMLPSNHTVIKLNSIPKTAKQKGIVAHEVFHAVDFILRRLGFQLSPKSCEAYAYLIGYITGKLYKNVNGKNGRHTAKQTI